MKTKKTITIDNIRNIHHLEFAIPNKGVHILTGKNGIGKSTLFTCLNRICDSNAYRLGFPSSKHSGYDEYRGSITYHVGNESVSYSRRSSGRWQPDTKNVIFGKYGFADVVHISTNDARIFTQEMQRPRARKDAESWIVHNMNEILDTDRFSKLKRITVGDLRSRNGNAASKRRNTAFAVPLPNKSYYSEQNFSFGEIVLLNLLYDIENVQENSLVLIDELEMALHPSAQIRLIDHIKELAEDRNLTVIISTHSSSIIRAQKAVILLEEDSDDAITVNYACSPARAVGAIGLRDENIADTIILVEDEMGKAFFKALSEQYKQLCPENNYLDLRVIAIGGWQIVIHFLNEAKGYIFYDNVYLAAFLDYDVKIDGNLRPHNLTPSLLQAYNNNKKYIHFLPDTPEIFILQTLISCRNDLINCMRERFNNQSIDYRIDDVPGLDVYYCKTTTSNERGKVRKTAKNIVEQTINSTAKQASVLTTEMYNFIYKFGVEKSIENNTINVRELLSQVMKRL